MFLFYFNKFSTKEPRLTLSLSGYGRFYLRNIGTTVARNITEKNGYFDCEISELLNYSGPCEESGFSNIARILSHLKKPIPKEVCVIFEYENLLKEKFESKFTIKENENSELYNKYTISDTDWQRI